MNDPLRARYDAMPYHHGAIPDSHPARIGAIARLLGIPAAAPEGCRVLELGCALGMNLLPLAERFPRAHFTGVDFSPVQIATGERARAACGIGNAHLLCADLRDFEPEPGAYDYVIAHGVYSWVPDEVKERVLAMTARALAPDGVAYVSYNTLPGWGLLDGLRAALRAELAPITDPAAQLEQTALTLDVLARCMADAPGAYAGLVREALADMTAKHPALLFHDELAEVNDPRTFTAFTNHAAQHGLHYLGEAHYAAMLFEHVPAPMRAALAELAPDFLRAQQFMDVIFHRWLRNSLLIRTAPPRTLDTRALRDCALGLRLRLAESSVNLQPGIPLRLHGATMDFVDPSEKALLAVLAQAAPARVPFAQALDRANYFLQQVRLPAVLDADNLCVVLHRLFSTDALDVALTGDGEWLRTSPTPGPSALMRHQARHNLPLANRWHELIDLTPEGRAALANPAQPCDDAALNRAGLLV